MTDLRSLLIDCRIELRKLSRDFQKTELCERLDLAIQAQANARSAPAPAAEAPVVNDAAPGLAPEKGQTVSQVALAWQTAVRDLKFSDPAIYARLGEKVMRLLAAKTLVDPATEIVQLEKQVAELRQSIEAQLKDQQAMAAERDALLGSLANAVPKLKDSGDRLAVALARVAWLKAEAEKGATAVATPGTPRAPEPQDTVPSVQLLTAAAAGAATFTREQREWCVGEAMVLTGFQFTPVELLEKGDSHIAKLILQTRQAG
jgi:HAMP domain-containing protein